jgi:hypothetical protein
MSARDAILAVIARETNQEIKGRTLLQKRLYFLSVLIGEDYEFQPHYFGPYSPLVSEALGSLVGAGFVDEVVRPLAGPPGRFGERRLFKYSLTDDGRNVVAVRKKELARFDTAIAKIADHPVARDPELLSIAAKVHYIVGESGGASIDEIREQASELAWKVKAEEINQVLVYLKQLGLVTVRDRAGV